MIILVANPGSTSYKCKLYETDAKTVLFQASVERIGDRESIFSYQYSDRDETVEHIAVTDVYTAIISTIERLTRACTIDHVAAVGFKTVVAKGVSGCVVLDNTVLEAMQAYMPLAPVHTHVYLTAIRVFKQIMPETPLIGVFETAFHDEIPPEVYLYGIPYEYYIKHGIRKYGFHGASHRYISERAKELYLSDRIAWKVISCHLGGSSSVCAVRDGKSIDTSMGMTPQSGVPNARRVGDLDVFALLYLMEQENLSIEETRAILSERSGLFGISGTSGDLRDIIAGKNSGTLRDTLAFDTYAYSVKKYIGEYFAVLNGADIIVFTAGSGQNAPVLRQEILKNLDYLGIFLDERKNEENPQEGLISTDESPVKIAVIPTDEEWIVAQAAEQLIRAQRTT